MDCMEPRTGPERGAALKRLIRLHDLTVKQFAELADVDPQTVAHLLNGDDTRTSPIKRHGKIVGRRQLGRDLATLAPKTAAKVARAVGELEPSWTDTDLWRALGIPEEVRGHWHLDRPSETPSRPSGEPQWHAFPRGTWGRIDLPVPVEIATVPGDGPLLVWRTGGLAAILPAHERGHGELLGALHELKLTES